MRRLDIANPYGAPVYWKETVSSTMDEARTLAAPHGTVIGADFQTRGRGRVRGRPWLGDAGDSLFFTVLLRYGSFAAVPPALTLRTGLALSRAVEAFAPPLADTLRIKWPNDLMVRFPGGARKIAGVLTESDGSAVFIGVGINVLQAGFPPSLRHKAASIAQALAFRADTPAPSADIPPAAARTDAPAPPRADAPVRADTPAPPPADAPVQAGVPAPSAGTPPAAARADIPAPPRVLSPESRFTLLEHVLDRLYRELEGGGPWRRPLEDRLYLKGERVRFVPGGADSGQVVEGLLHGIGPAGELLVLPPGAAEPLAFVTGELDLYGTAPAAGA